MGGFERVLGKMGEKKKKSRNKELDNRKKKTEFSLSVRLQVLQRLAQRK